MNPIVFLSIFLSSALISLTLFIIILNLLLNDFWLYTSLIISLIILSYTFNIMNQIQISKRENKAVDILLSMSENKDIMQLRRSSRIQQKKEIEVAEALLMLSK